PHFKDKIQIAIEMFDNALESFDFSATAFDSWYSSKRFLEHIHAKDKNLLLGYAVGSRKHNM
ncbi:MAG: hypothetical protein GY788_15785, partial [bacterium]|nr:hypothetical protein [bacterium]